MSCGCLECDKLCGCPSKEIERLRAALEKIQRQMDREECCCPYDCKSNRHCPRCFAGIVADETLAACDETEKKT